ncbi:MAG TPA: hypothetical protein V6D30_13170 [Leptolyngbyaceae cyanobacterium]
MNISLTEDDLSQMPSALRTSLLHWQMTKMSAIGQTPVHRHPSQPKEATIQLSLLTEPENQVPEPETKHTHVALTQLYDAGITKPGMFIRVRLKKDIARKRGRSYFDNLRISDRGTIIYEGNEFNKPRPLVAKINGTSAPGWDYVEAKVDEVWVRLEQLRQSLRQTSVN